MLFEIVAGTSLATFVGAKLAREKLYKPKLIEILQPANPISNGSAQPDVYQPNSIAKLRADFDDRYQQFIQRHVDSLLGSKRQQQLQTLSIAQVDWQERQLNRFLGLAALNFAWVSFCTLFVPALVITTVPVLFYLYWNGPLKQAYYSLVKERRITVAVLDSMFCMLALATRYFFAAALGAFLALSIYKAVARLKDSAQQKLVDVFSQHPQSVWIVVDGIEISIPFENIKVGDTFVVQAGEVVPSDGRIIQGIATLDQQALTGESQPAEKKCGDWVLASTTVLSGKIYVEVTEAGDETVAAKIGALLNQTTDHKTNKELKALKLVDKSTMLTIALGLLAYPIAGAGGALAILMTSLGYSMRVLGPIGTLRFLQITSRKNLLIKDGRALDILPSIDTVVFDKTGTLTQEQPLVSQLHLLNGCSADTLLTYAAAAEHKQTHPIAKAILQAARERQLPLPEIDEAHYEIGYGIQVQLEGQTIRVGSVRFIEAENIHISPETTQIYEQCQHQGHSLVLVAIDQHLAGAIELQPTVRPEAKTVIEQLQQRGLDTAIISGDQEGPTQTLAQQLGIDSYFANTLPEQKAELIQDLQQQGKKVCFIGDGINDSIALRQADVAISLRGATTAAIDTAQIILMDEQLNKLPQLFEIASSFEQNQKNIFISSIIPGIICVGSVFIFHTGVYFAYLVYYSGLLFGLGNATRPLLDTKSSDNE